MLPAAGRGTRGPSASDLGLQRAPLQLPASPPLPPCAQLLGKLPTATPRGLALQQFGGAVLLERLLPANHKLAPSKSAINRREPGALDPAAVVAAQPWIGEAKALVAGATSGAAQVPRGGYGIGAWWG